MVRILQPWYINTKKRLIKRPKVYIRDSGIFHSLISIENQDQLLSHNKLGASWEGFALECTSSSIGKRNEELYFWGTHAGGEIDLFWQGKGKNWGAEFKNMDAPRRTRSMNTAIEDLNIEHLWVIYPGKETYKLAANITVMPLSEIPATWHYA